MSYFKWAITISVLLGAISAFQNWAAFSLGYESGCEETTLAIKKALSPAQFGDMVYDCRQAAIKKVGLR